MAGKERSEGSAERLISLAEAAEISGFSPSHLRYLVSHKIIWGCKIGRNWLTTKEAVLEYKRRGVRPGPKPRQ